MAISAGTLVRCYNSPTYIYEVVEADVPRDVDIEDYRNVWRLPNGNTLLENTTKDGYYVVAAENSLHTVR